jgi:hypothetical protein
MLYFVGTFLTSDWHVWFEETNTFAAIINISPYQQTIFLQHSFDFLTSLKPSTSCLNNEALVFLTLLYMESKRSMKETSPATFQQPKLTVAFKQPEILC